MFVAQSKSHLVGPILYKLQGANMCVSLFSKPSRVKRKKISRDGGHVSVKCSTGLPFRSSLTRRPHRRAQ